MKYTINKRVLKGVSSPLSERIEKERFTGPIPYLLNFLYSLNLPLQNPCNHLRASVFFKRSLRFLRKRVEGDFPPKLERSTCESCKTSTWLNPKRTSGWWVMSIKGTKNRF